VLTAPEAAVLDKTRLALPFHVTSLTPELLSSRVQYKYSTVTVTGESTNHSPLTTSCLAYVHLLLLPHLPVYLLILILIPIPIHVHVLVLILILYYQLPFFLGWQTPLLALFTR